MLFIGGPSTGRNVFGGSRDYSVSGAVFQPHRGCAFIVRWDQQSPGPPSERLQMGGRAFAHLSHLAIFKDLLPIRERNGFNSAVSTGSSIRENRSDPLTPLLMKLSKVPKVVFRSAKETDARVQLPCVKIIRYSARSHIVTAGEAWPRALHHPFCTRSEQRLWAARHWGPDFVH